MNRITAATIAFALLAGSSVHAQEELARRFMRVGLDMAAAGDTAAALFELRKAVEAAPDLAEAYYELAHLLAARARTEAGEFTDRVEAEAALLEALELDPANPLYQTALERLRVVQRPAGEAQRVLRVALADVYGGNAVQPADIADLHYNLGYVKEVSHERLRDRRMPRPGLGSIDVSASPGTVWLGRYVEWYLENAPPIPGLGDEKRDDIIDHYRAALRADPDRIEPAGRLLVHLLALDRTDEYLAIARELVEANPERAEPHLYLGLGLHAAGREDEAAAAFEEGLARQAPEDRAPFLDIGPILRRRAAGDYRALDEGLQRGLETSFWRLTDPLYMTGANEARLEHYARVTYADLRFAEPVMGLRGWETARGIIFIRYGPPDEVGRVAGCDMGPSSQSIVWRYDFGPVFIFCALNGFIRTRFAGDYEWVANETRHQVPFHYGNIPSIPMRAPIPIQIARFRGATPDELAVEVHGELPLEALAAGLELESGELGSGIFVLDAAGNEIVRDVGSQVLRYDEASARRTLRSWRLIVPASAGPLVTAVEVRDAGTWRAAAGRDTFTARLYPRDSLSVSDILLAEGVRPLAPEPRHRSDFDIVATPSMSYAPHQPVHIYYEVYGLDRDDEGFASFEVALAVTVKALSREGTVLGGDRNPLAILGLLADAWGFSVVGDDRLELRFSREVDLGDGDRVPEYLSLDLRDAPPGEYEIELKIWDSLAERLATQTRSFSVVRE